MRLRRLVLSGFKTFAHRTEIRFEPGITGVVGPNGSGKSNLVDAVRWALGETNARELRGTRLDEMIFAGGQGRGRMGVAEVEMVLDNEDGRLPMEDAEVGLSRRVVRGGDVEYRVNGERARLRDLERLLDGTGLTQHGYAVVAQQDIESIIEATPRQRRALVEQAAGVRPLRVACDDVLARLERVDAAVQRLSDRLGESEPRLAQLAAEREAALALRGLAERLTSLRGSLAREAWRAARAQARQAQRRLEAAARRLEAAGEAEAAYAERVGAARSRLDAARAAQRSVGERLEAARVAAERSHGETRRFSDRASTAVLHRADARRQARSAGLEAETARHSLEELEGADVQSGSRRQELEAKTVDLSARSREATSDWSEAEHALREAERGLGAAVEAALSARVAARERSQARERLESSLGGATAEVASGQSRVEGLESAAAGARARLDELDAAAGAAEAEATRHREQLELAGRQLRAAEVDHHAARELTAEALARAATLQGQADGRLGGTGVVATHAAELGAVRLVDSIHVRDPADAPAIEAALEPHLGAWVVADVERALDLLRRAAVREEVLAASRSGWLPAGAALPALSGRGAAGFERGPAPEGEGAAAIRAAFDALEVEGTARDAAAHCLARTWLVPDLAAARRVAALPGSRAVLPDGSVLTAGGARSGGAGAATLELVAEARRAEAAAGNARVAEAAAAVAVLTCAEAAAAADAGFVAASDALALRRREAAEATAHSTAAAMAASLESTHLAALVDAVERQTSVLSMASAAAEAAALEAAQADERCNALRQAVEAARLRSAELSERSELATALLTRTAAELAELRRMAEEADRRRTEIEERRRGAERRLADAEARVATAEIQVLIALARGSAAAAEVRAAEIGVTQAEADLAEASRPVAALETSLNALETERGEVRVAVARAEDEVAAARSEVGTAELRLAEHAEAVRDEVEDDTAELDPAAAERVEREIARLERQIAAMGPVNALAPEQHEALEDRVAGLRADRDDLAVAAAQLRNLVHRFQAEAARRFEAVFGAVGAQFTEMFSELFPGGAAALRLDSAPRSGAAPREAGEELAPAGETGDDEPAGVEILAQPAGKRLQPLSHLSGGERALTALAMIFALQQVNPSPFYMFDEVDAALDDTSVLRFTRLLTRLATRQQFIVVTHNHVTMAAADALYGVTIDREGVSSLLSVRFSERETADVTGVLQAPLRRVAS